MSTEPVLPEDIPPHLVHGAAVMRPLEGVNIHVRLGDRCLAAQVVNVDSEDPLGAVFVVDAVIFQPPIKSKDKWQKANTRPGSVRWMNNMQFAAVEDNTAMTWHYPGQGCLPPVVLDFLAKQAEGQS